MAAILGFAAYINPIYNAILFEMKSLTMKSLFCISLPQITILRFNRILEEIINSKKYRRTF